MKRKTMGDVGVDVDIDVEADVDAEHQRNPKRFYKAEEPSLEGPKESLCQSCSQIDFLRIFSKIVKTPDGRWEACVGNPSNESLCPLCRFFTAMIPRLDHSIQGEQGRLHHRWQEKGSPYFLKAFSVDRVFGLAINKSLIEANGPDGVLLTVLPGWLRKLNASMPDKWKPWKNTDKKPGFIALSGDGSNSLEFHGHRLSTSTINWDVVHSWASFCCERHGDNCVEHSNRAILGFKVIDCETRNIVDAPIDCTYLTLSYVWGESSAAVADFSRRLPDVCPLVIEDAIQVVKRLSHRYLWIDRFCINQQDRMEKHDQIANMDSIYARSFLTIVAAAGESSSYGLPGISTTLRVVQPWASVQDHLLVSSLLDPIHTIKNSKWMTRGWTYQEGILAKRRLIFTDHQVYFQCLGMYCVESLHMPLDRWHTKSNGRFRDQMSFSRLFPSTSVAKRPDDFLQRINEYSKRDLSYESDSLNAVLGVLKVFELADPPIYHHWGIPLFPQQEYFRFNSWITSHAVALSWKSEKPATRRIGFPSWSWVGWKDWEKFKIPMADTNYWKKLENCTWRSELTRGKQHKFWHGNLRIGIQDRETKSVMSLEDDGTNIHALARSSPRIYITAATATLKSSDTRSFGCIMPDPWREWPFHDMIPHNGDWDHQSWKAILLGVTQVYPAQATFLVVRAVEDCYERVGVCTLQISVSAAAQYAFSEISDDEVAIGDVKLPTETLILV